MSDNVDPVEFARLQERVEGLVDLKSDVKTILTSVQAIEVQMAKVPTYSDLSPIKDRIQDLEETKAEAKGAWKVMAVAGSVIGAVSGIAGALLSKLASQSSVATVASDAAKHFLGK